MNTSFRVAACLAIICLFFSCQSQSKIEKLIIEEGVTRDQAATLLLTQELESIYEKGHINGFAVAICNNDGTLYKAGIGLSDAKHDFAYTTSTIQNIGSVSKTLIGIALLKAKEEGDLSLDDPIEQYLPFDVANPFHSEVPITIRHLATHTSSITDTDYYDQYAYYLHKSENLEEYDLSNSVETFHPFSERMQMGELLESLLSINGSLYDKNNYKETEPGSSFEYSNIGATLVAYILEQATGFTYNEYTGMHILEPLSMSASGWSFDTISMGDHSTLYSTPDSPLPKYSLVTYPDGGLLTTVNDLAKYLSELIRGKQGKGTLLRTESYTELFTPQLSASHFSNRNKSNAYNDEYNSGIFMGFTPKDYIGHTGSDPGVASYMFFNPETNLGRILIINTQISSRKSAGQFLAIWNALDDFEDQFNYIK